MNTNNEKIILSRVAFGLVIFGLLGPFILSIWLSWTAAFLCGICSLILAVVFALITKKHLLSKVTLGLSLTVAVALGARFVWAQNEREEAYTQQLNKMQEHKQKMSNQSE
jgi:ABC-type uncharacterized transport system permease subunit